jgi:hypothetical protein
MQGWGTAKIFILQVASKTSLRDSDHILSFALKIFAFVHSLQRQN